MLDIETDFEGSLWGSTQGSFRKEDLFRTRSDFNENLLVMNLSLGVILILQIRRNLRYIMVINCTIYNMNYILKSIFICKIIYVYMNISNILNKIYC